MTGDTHPIHIHQSQFQPLDVAGALLSVVDASGANLYDPACRMTSAPIVPDATCHGRAFEPPETLGWKDVIRVDPGNVVKVAIRLDIPGRYVYHCGVLEHEDTEMMRPFVVTVMHMDDGRYFSAVAGVEFPGVSCAVAQRWLTPAYPNAGSFREGEDDAQPSRWRRDRAGGPGCVDHRRPGTTRSGRNGAARSGQPGCRDHWR
ncbi:MAG: multicopper oxidase domain-containing protein [Actinomycetota bacterium]|nr:multicopper oxidase domain-containing protein [Actinomycetota bacterium]